MSRNVLVLGGTADGRWLAKQLIIAGYKVTYSIAGLVRTPKLDCDLVVGGFTQYGGLTSYLRDNSISLVVNATHPYAAQMTNKSVAAGREANVPVWRFLRPAWQPAERDVWQYYRDEEVLLGLLGNYRRPFLSAGQMSQAFIHSLSGLDAAQQVLWRTAVRPKFDLPPNVVWHKAIGPFSLSAERALLQHHQIDVMVTKNSGGNATSAKLEAARDLSVPVLLHARPSFDSATATFDSLPELMAALRRDYTSHSRQQQDMQQQ